MITITAIVGTVLYDNLTDDEGGYITVNEFSSYVINPLREIRVDSSCKSSATHSFLSVCAVFSCVRTMAWLPVF